jgi:hypothetical protein
VPRTLTEVIVFIGGPTDVDDEVRAALSIIGSLDKVLCPAINLHLRATRGSEDAPSGPGRPQARINPLVNECHLFVGIFATKIGTPTGDYESGSREELQIALDRYAVVAGEPEIKVFFRDVPDVEPQGTNAQLAAVLALRAELAPNFLYVKYADINDFRRRFLEQLLSWVLAKWPVMRRPEPSPTPPAPPAAPSTQAAQARPPEGP